MKSDNQSSMINEIQPIDQLTQKPVSFWEKINVKLRAISKFCSLQSNARANNSIILQKRTDPSQAGEINELPIKKKLKEEEDTQTKPFGNHEILIAKHDNQIVEMNQHNSFTNANRMECENIHQSEVLKGVIDQSADIFGAQLRQQHSQKAQEAEDQTKKHLKEGDRQDVFDEKKEIEGKHENSEEQVQLEDSEDENEDDLVDEECIEVIDAKIEQNKGDFKAGQNENEMESVSLWLNEEEDIITIRICERVYVIETRKPLVRQNERLLRIINEIADLIEQLRAKQTQKIRELQDISQHNQLTALEYFLMKTLHDILKEERNLHHLKWQDEICCICQCELFEDIDKYTHEDFLNQLKNSSEEDSINLKHCEAHFFHKACLQLMIHSSYIKCPVCSKIYGTMIGDQPPGKMIIYLDKQMRCEGYLQNSTIKIEMSFRNTQKNGNFVPSTHRVGYLPNNKEGRVVLDMFKQAFKRRLLFTIGRSVTTGKDNRIIWNGVHFKTNTVGGYIKIVFIYSSSNFGYPDPTYLQRVTQELSLKGIYPRQNIH